jgi:CRISPR/Cas system-associated exonuclease Cas4 (RecB family)
VINATQSAATVLYQPLAFLRQDKRAALGLSDTDASAAFFRLYRTSPLLRITASDNTFSGWAIPHSFFAERVEAVRAEKTQAEQALPKTKAPAGDAFSQERLWWAASPQNDTSQAGSPAPDFPMPGFPAMLYSVQKNGFARWQSLLEITPARRFSLLRQAFTPDRPAAGQNSVTELIQERIAERQRNRSGTPQEGLLRVSATDLNNFFFCSAFWFYQKILQVTDLSLEAKLLDDASMGNLYHEILRKLFTRIRENHGVFAAAQLDTYNTWVEECTAEAARDYPAFQGPLAEPLISSQARAISRRLWALLKIEAAAFDGYRVGPLEETFGFKKGGLWLNGKLDRVSFSPDDGAVIIDYKTGEPPAKSSCTMAELRTAADSTGEETLSDFQIPMYIRLYEERSQEDASAAMFMSINKNKVVTVVGEAGGKKGLPREAYKETLKCFDEYIEDFEKRVESLDFAPPDIRFKNCAACAYRNICRTVFSLNSREEEAHG